MEDDLKILKMEYLSNPLLDCTQLLNLSLKDQTVFNGGTCNWDTLFGVMGAIEKY
jgi:hypothetical protein